MGKVTNSPKLGDNGKKPQDKKKKRRIKKSLDDLHRKLGKPAKRNRKSFEAWQSHFVKVLHRFADVRQEYGKDTKTDGKSGKERNSRRAANRILGRPLSGIYRNGAVGKEIRRTQTKLPFNDLNNARLEGDVMKLLHGYDANSKGIMIESSNRERSNDQMIDSTAKEIFQSTLADLDCVSPVLLKMNGRKRYCKEESDGNADLWGHKILSQMILEKKKSTNSKFQQHSAIQRYEELCATVSAENFDRLSFPDQSVADPLTTVKRKLRSTYAETFHNQFLRDMIKRGNIISEHTPRTSTPSPILPEVMNSSSGYGESGELIAGNVDNSVSQTNRRTHTKDADSLVNPSGFLLSRSNFQLNNSAKEIPTPRLLFSFPSLASKSTADTVESKQERNLRRLNSDVDFLGSSARDHTSLEVNCPPSHPKNLLYSDIPEQQRSKTMILAQCKMSRESTIKRQLIKRRNQRTQTTGSLRRHPAMSNAKIAHHEKEKSMRHMPAILRRCNKANLFDEASLDQTKKKFQFTPVSPPSIRSDLTDNFNCTSDLVVQTCVIASPSLRRDESQCDQQLNNIFSKRNKRTQKTVMFTRKDSRNAGHCLFVNDMMPDRPADTPSICLARKDLLQQQEKCSRNVCAAHRSCQRATSNCHRSFCCSQVSEDSNYCSQELNEAAQLRPVHLQEPVFCEKMLLKKLHQHPVRENNQHCHGKNQTVCFLTLDEDSSDRQDYSGVSAPAMEKSRTLKDGIYRHKEMADVGLLKGVQNLQILPMEESRVKCSSDRCIGKTVLVEEQPVKYLAFDNDSETQRLPIYIQKQPQFASADNTDANYRLISCPAEYTQKILLVPTRENSKVMYVKEADLNRPGVSFERVVHPRKMFYRPDQLNVQNASNVCEVHVPKQNVLEVGNHGTILQQRDHEKRSRNTVEHTIVRDACAKNQTVYYKE
ncbi:uncharacterized protein LOC116424365 isoform X1 [Nomia melanderi]|uniref:uncharacterized protein LOC116424365 isoform X1 n=1 Tax=Nomia melanderi TaxID=2448451 RepID=UPI003FCE6F65